MLFSCTMQERVVHGLEGWSIKHQGAYCSFYDRNISM